MTKLLRVECDTLTLTVKRSGTSHPNASLGVFGARIFGSWRNYRSVLLNPSIQQPGKREAEVKDI